MKIEYEQYRIELTDASTYSLNSSDNIEKYQLEYFQGTQNEDRFYPTSKHGIRLFENDIEINSAVVCAVGGTTGIHENSFLIENDNILICCCDKIYSLKIPELSINWTKRLDLATCFGIFEFKDDLIVHGELQILRIDKKGNIKWEFGGRDIFTTPDGKDDIKIGKDTIRVKDWNGYEYILNEFGFQIL
jgi:hypothetical protein